MNSHLKEIGQLAGVNSLTEKLTFDKGQPVRTMVPKHELLTVHTARHTFATQSLLKGMTVEVLQKILGHMKIQNTLVYAKIVDDFKHQMMLNVWNN
jgi:site-specific recombinase XerD